MGRYNIKWVYDSGGGQGEGEGEEGEEGWEGGEEGEEGEEEGFVFGEGLWVGFGIKELWIGAENEFPVNEPFWS